MISYDYENGWCVRDAFLQAGLPITQDMIDGDIDLDTVDLELESHGYTIFDKNRENLHLLKKGDLEGKPFFLQINLRDGLSHLEYHLPDNSIDHKPADIVGIAVILD